MPRVPLHKSGLFLTLSPPLLLLLLTALLVVPHSPASATLVASSKIQYCTNSGVEPPNCNKKMVVTLTVDGGQLAGQEEIATVSTASDDTAAGATVRFVPLTLTTSRSVVSYRYPIFYVQNYNAKPYEQTLAGSLLNTCNADYDVSKATCGVARDTKGELIPYSQGFCCGCNMCQVSGLCTESSRAKGSCNLFGDLTSASCLRFGERWYSGYTIGSAGTWYTINVTLSGSGSGNQTLRLSPDTTGAQTDQYGTVSARLLGDFNPTEQPLDLTTRMLFAPALPAGDARVKAGPAEWMILDKTRVTLDGRECNKVGVSYEAFASQGNACRLNPGSCLASQLEDLRSEDLESGKAYKYMATGFGDFDLARFGTGGDLSPYITYVAKSPAATMLTVVLDADDVQYTLAVAAGKIVDAVMNSNSVEAATRDGLLTVTVKNIGAITAGFTLSVTNCSNGIFPMADQRVSLAAGEARNSTFNVYGQDIYYTGLVNCTAVLRDSTEAVTDTRLVSWTSTSVNFDNGTQGGSGGSGGSGTSTKGKAESCSACGLISVACAFSKGCAKQIAFQLGMVALLVALLGVCVYFRRPLLRLLCCCCKGVGKRQRRNNGSGEQGRGSDPRAFEPAYYPTQPQQQQQQFPMAYAAPPSPSYQHNGGGNYYYNGAINNNINAAPPVAAYGVPYGGYINGSPCYPYGGNDNGYGMPAPRSPSPRCTAPYG